MAQYKSYTHVLRIDKDEVQGILCGDVIVMPKLDGTNACLFMKDGTVHAGSRTREINMNKEPLQLFIAFFGIMGLMAIIGFLLMLTIFNLAMLKMM